MVRLQRQPGAWKDTMPKKKNRVLKSRPASSKLSKPAGARKTAGRKMYAASKIKAKDRNRNPGSKLQPQHTSAGANRSEGIRLFALAGRPTRDQFTRVYGPAGPKMTWQQRAAAGIPAEKFQAALASAGQRKK